MTPKKDNPKEQWLADTIRAMWRGQKGAAELYAIHYKNELRYVRDLGIWLVWSGVYWREDKHFIAESNVERVVEIYEQVKEQSKGNKDLVEAIQKQINKLHEMKGVSAVLRSAMTVKYADNTPMLTVNSDQLDQKMHLLACKNKVVDLRNSTAKEPDSEDLITVVCEAEWQGMDAPRKRFLRFMAEILPDEQVRRYLQKILGYALLGECSQHYMFVMLGEGRNGKSTLFELLFWLLGKTVFRAITPEILLAQKYGGIGKPSPEVMSLRGLRGAVASEVDEHQHFSMSAVKRLTGGDTLVGRPPHGKHEIVFIPTAAFFLLCNSMPHCKGGDKTFIGRLRVIEFPVTVVEGTPDPKKNEIAKDPNLDRDLRKEGAGILAWLVEGALMYQKEGLIAPEAVVKAGITYKENEDKIGLWLKDQQSPENGQTQSSELFKKFNEWLEKNNMGKGWSITAFGKEMGKRFKREKLKGNQYYPIILKP